MQPDTIFCDSCRAAARPTARFCPSCGHPLPVASPLAPPAAPFSAGSGEHVATVLTTPFPQPSQVPLPAGYWEQRAAELAARRALLPPAVPEHFLVCAYRGHRRSVSTLAWSPDGQQIASGGENATIQVWQAADASPRLSCPDSFQVVALAWSPDGTRLASAGLDG